MAPRTERAAQPPPPTKTSPKTKRYRLCKSATKFYTDEANKIEIPCAKLVNESLNLNLGLPINPMICRPVLHFIFKLLMTMGGYPLEYLLMYLWKRIPLSIRHVLFRVSWSLYFKLHKCLVNNRSGISKTEISLEYHALTSIAYWGRLFPMTVEKMRFALSQVEVYFPPQRNNHIESVVVVVDEDESLSTKGYYIYYNENRQPSECVICWFYGGAYLSGDCQGNLGIAERVAMETHCDVYIPETRLLPEHDFMDAIKDGKNALKYLQTHRNYDTRNICLFGISSGGGIASYLLQEEEEELYNNRGFRGAVLMCPFVDYTEPEGSLRHYIDHDLIVNQSVYEIGIPYMAIKLGDDPMLRKAASPVYRSFENVKHTPLLVVVSEHEACYDMCVKFVNNAREAGVSCEIASWKFLCHVFPVFYPILPEGEEAMKVMCSWLKLRVNE